jgi:hypothetical protein
LRLLPPTTTSAATIIININHINIPELGRLNLLSYHVLCLILLYHGLSAEGASA